MWSVWHTVGHIATAYWTKIESNVGIRECWALALYWYIHRHCAKREHTIDFIIIIIIVLWICIDTYMSRIYYNVVRLISVCMRISRIDLFAQYLHRPFLVKCGIDLARICVKRPRTHCHTLIGLVRSFRLFFCSFSFSFCLVMQLPALPIGDQFTHHTSPIQITIYNIFFYFLYLLSADTRHNARNNSNETQRMKYNLSASVDRPVTCHIGHTSFHHIHHSFAFHCMCECMQSNQMKCNSRLNRTIGFISTFSWNILINLSFLFEIYCNDVSVGPTKIQFENLVFNE